MFQTECTACGLSVHDLPDELGDRELVREQFFDFADDGHLYCRGCAASGEGVFLCEPHAPSDPARASAGREGRR